MATMTFSMGDLLIRFFWRDRSFGFKSHSISRVIHTFFIGAAGISLLGAVLGKYFLLRYTTLIFLTTPLVAVFPFLFHSRIQQFWKNFALGSRERSIALALIALQITYLFLTKALPPDHETVDSLGHYLPYYESIFHNGGVIWPTPFFYNYFFLKGAGFPLIMGALTDVNSTQLCSFLFFLATGLIVFSWMTTLRPSVSWLPLVGVLAYLANRMVLDLEFQKIHMISGGFLLYLTFAISEWHLFGRPRRWDYILFVALVLAIMNPTFSIFVAVVLFFQLLFAIVDRKKLLIAPLFAVGTAVSLAVGLTLFQNYIETGFAEVTPAMQILKLSDPLRRPPSVLLNWIWYVVAQEGAVNNEFSTFHLSGFLVQLWSFLTDGILGASKNILWLLVDYSMLVFLVVKYRKHNQPIENQRYLFWLSFAILSSIFVLSIGIKQGSFQRGLLFLPAFRIIFFFIFAINLVDLLNTRLRIQNQKWAPLVILAIALGFAVHYDCRTAGAFPFALGAESFAEFYGFSPDDPCTEARAKVGPTDRIFLLHFQPACTGKPSDRIDKGDFPMYQDDNRQVVLLKPPREARNDLEKMGINHFLFVPGWDSNFYPFLPLFSLESMQENFKLESRLKNGFLLTWRKPDEEKIPDEILKLYRDQLAKYRDSKEQTIFGIWLERRANGEH
jgi:hypothetical protein